MFCFMLITSSYASYLHDPGFVDKSFVNYINVNKEFTNVYKCDGLSASKISGKFAL